MFTILARRSRDLIPNEANRRLKPRSQAGTHCAYPRRDGHAVLSSPGWLVTYRDGSPVLKAVSHPSRC